MARIYLSPPHMGSLERELLLEAFDSNWIAPLGPHVDAFEREFADKVGLAHAVALSSGTAALHLALLLLGVSTGDEVVTSSLTFAASANAITYVGARPVFVDASASTWNIDPALFAEELDSSARAGKLPKAALVVDLYGQSADHDPLRAACVRHGIPLIEDAAEALGATYNGRAAGTWGDLSAFSFNGNKIITTSGGGMLGCSSSAQAQRARFLATQARDPAPHYQHSVVGYNYRLSNLLAAVGRAQLRALDSRIEARRRIHARYVELLADLPGIEFMPEAPYGRSTRWLTCITVDPAAFGATREDVRVALEALDIEARPVWKPMHMQPVFNDCRMRGGSVAERLFAHGLCLPSGSAMTDSQIEQVAEVTRSVHARSEGGRTC